VIAIEPHPITHARLAFNRAASGFAQVRWLAPLPAFRRRMNDRRPDGDISAPATLSATNSAGMPSGCPRCGCSVFPTMPAWRCRCAEIDVEAMRTGF